MNEYKPDNVFSLIALSIELSNKHQPCPKCFYAWIIIGQCKVVFGTKSRFLTLKRSLNLLCGVCGTSVSSPRVIIANESLRLFKEVFF